MKKRSLHIGILSTLLLVLLFSTVSCNTKIEHVDTSKLEAKVDSLENQLKKFNDEKALTEMRLIRFDSLDFDIYSNAKWDQLHISHADNILVTYPDGHQTKEIGTHIDELKPQFVFAPDTKITSHPVKFGSGDWTSVIGEMEGTFTKPMPIGNGKFIPPTGKKFKLPMCTVGKWKDGKMIEEYLFWDNMAFMKQVGIAQ
ncbi:ester cyclase [Flavobacterium sp. '19STA2R22 D10 B1']|uniref:ester cyclase n=1 Tax=Flavobacterium aerium TaxID=3037261 RepID=UPI00278C3D90|nr:ester cyclase [Flavobacterium sp. '19STA2R22 D10 B1']